MKEAAEQRYGKAAAADMAQAWRQFSDAFREFPYGVHVYMIPTQHGPANPLRLRDTGYRAGIMLFPYDDYKGWSGQYPPEVAQKQFAKTAALWKVGVESMERALANVPPGKRRDAELDLAIAKTCFHHFQSTANQFEFYLLRDGRKTPEALAMMRAIADQEIELWRSDSSAWRAIIP